MPGQKIKTQLTMGPRSLAWNTDGYDGAFWTVKLTLSLGNVISASPSVNQLIQLQLTQEALRLTTLDTYNPARDSNVLNSLGNDDRAEYSLPATTTTIPIPRDFSLTDLIFSDQERLLYILDFQRPRLYKLAVDKPEDPIEGVVDIELPRKIQLSADSHISLGLPGRRAEESREASMLITAPSSNCIVALDLETSKSKVVVGRPGQPGIPAHGKNVGISHVGQPTAIATDRKNGTLFFYDQSLATVYGITAARDIYELVPNLWPIKQLLHYRYYDHAGGEEPPKVSKPVFGDRTWDEAWPTMLVAVDDKGYISKIRLHQSVKSAWRLKLGLPPVDRLLLWENGQFLLTHKDGTMTHLLTMAMDSTGAHKDLLSS